MSLEHAILGLLSEQPRSGYDLKTRCFDETLSALWPADQAQIYRTLEKLHTERLVTVTRKRQAGRPDRKVYSLTQAGYDALDRWLTAQPEPVIHRDPFMLRLHFAADLDDEALLRLLRASRRERVLRLDSLRVRSTRLAQDHSLPARAQILRQTAFDGAATRERSAIEWIDDCIAAIEEGALPGSETHGPGQRSLFGQSPA